MTDIYKVQVYRKLAGTTSTYTCELDESTTAQSPDGALQSILDIHQAQRMHEQAKDKTYENEVGPRPGGVWREHPLHG